MRYRVTDLETAAHPDAHLWVDPVKADSRLKDPAKIEESIKEKTAERDERLGLDPDCNRIVALGWHDIGQNVPIVRICKNEDEERAALIEYWTTYTTQPTTIVGFNSAKFDLVVMLMRSIYLKVRRPKGFVISPAWKSPHVDLFEKLSLGGARDRKDIKGLRFYARRLGIPIYDDISGADVAAMVKAGEWGKIQNHCLFDLDLTRAVGEEIGELEPQAVGAPF